MRDLVREVYADKIIGESLAFKAGDAILTVSLRDEKVTSLDANPRKSVAGEPTIPDREPQAERDSHQSGQSASGARSESLRFRLGVHRCRKWESEAQSDILRFVCRFFSFGPTRSPCCATR